MKVLILNSLYAPHIRGGAERSLQMLAEALVADGVEVVVGCTAPAALPAQRHNGVEVIYVHGLNIFWPFDGSERPALARKAWHLLDMYNPAGGRAVAALLRECRPDIVHTNNLRGFSVAAWGAIANAGLPILHTVRDDYLRCARSLGWKASGPCVGTCAECLPHASVRRAATRHVAGVTAVSRTILDAHLGQGFFKGARVAREVYNPAPEVRSQQRDPGRPVRFGVSGRIEAEKGLGVLLEAMVRRPAADWKLIVAGRERTPFADELRARYASLLASGRVEFRGWMEVDDFFAAIDIAVVPSLYPEPASRVVLEAFAAGVPLIVSRRGGMQELVEDGVSGLLFEPNDAASLDSALERATADPAALAPLAAAGARIAVSLRAADVACRYRDIYRDLVAA